MYNEDRHVLPFLNTCDGQLFSELRNLHQAEAVEDVVRNSNGFLRGRTRLPPLKRTPDARSYSDNRHRPSATYSIDCFGFAVLNGFLYIPQSQNESRHHQRFPRCRHSTCQTNVVRPNKVRVPCLLSGTTMSCPRTSGLRWLLSLIL